MFSYGYYRSLLEQLNAEGYQFCRFGDYAPKGRVYLRHDVDFDIFSVRELAKVELAVKSNAIYFFQPNNDLYNFTCKTGIGVLNELLQMGHEIALHIDASPFSNKADLVQYILDCFAFYRQFAQFSKVISFHRPSQFVLEDLNLPGFIGTYEEKYLKNITYISDSNRRKFWEESRLQEAIRQNTSIQLLTHPIWWKEDEWDLEKIRSYLHAKAMSEIVDQALINNCKQYSYLKGEYS